MLFNMRLKYRERQSMKHSLHHALVIKKVGLPESSRMRLTMFNTPEKEQWTKSIRTMIAQTEGELAITTSLISDFAGLKRSIEELKSLFSDLSAKPITYSTKIYDLGTDELTLKRPLDIVIEQYEDECISRIPELEVFGSGYTESISIAELKKEMIILYLDLIGSDINTLGALPKMWLRILEPIIVKEQ